MKVLVVGNGGREDALIWKIAQSELVSQVWCAPRRDRTGFRSKTKCLPLLSASGKPADNLALANFARDNVDLTCVGPEAPLILGIVDIFTARRLPIFGPTKNAARLEGSKVWAKDFMRKYEIPTATYKTFSDPEDARRYAKANLPCFIKPDGLTGGHGPTPCRMEEDVDAAIQRIMIDKEFEESGNLVVVEEMLFGKELSYIVLTDGEAIIPLLPARDYKTVFDDDKGPNTGGMGACAPMSISGEMELEIIETIIRPTLAGMKKEGCPYKGVLYAGLMITDKGPKVLEFNCRFGDPETQAVLPLMKSDIVPILGAIANGKLAGEKVTWSAGAAVCVVMTSGGYPDDKKYQKGKIISGWMEAEQMENVVIFHAGTRLERGIWRTDGGRVLDVVARDKSLSAAVDRIYVDVLPRITWKDEHHRGDIGQDG